MSRLVRSPRLLVRVECSCGWSGGRSATLDPASRPCFKCGGVVQVATEPYPEQGAMPVACTQCDWYGARPRGTAVRPCYLCDGPVVQLVVTWPDGRPFEPAHPQS